MLFQCLYKACTSTGKKIVKILPCRNSPANLPDLIPGTLRVTESLSSARAQFAARCYAQRSLKDELCICWCHQIRLEVLWVVTYYSSTRRTYISRFWKETYRPDSTGLSFHNSIRTCLLKLTGSCWSIICKHVGCQWSEYWSVYSDIIPVTSRYSHLEDDWFTYLSYHVHAGYLRTCEQQHLHSLSGAGYPRVFLFKRSTFHRPLSQTTFFVYIFHSTWFALYSLQFLPPLPWTRHLPLQFRSSMFIFQHITNAVRPINISSLSVRVSWILLPFDARFPSPRRSEISPATFSHA